MRHHQGLREGKRMTRTMLRCAICSAVLLALPFTFAQAAQETPAKSFQVAGQRPLMRDGTFRSAALKRDAKYRIYLPHGYSVTARRYPVLYLLHGLYGDYRNWDTLTQLSRYMAGRNWIVVMPDAGNSWYVNSTSQADDRFDDYISHDLVQEIDRKYRTIQEREGRAIAGLSMGGYGAIKFALEGPKHMSLPEALAGRSTRPATSVAKLRNITTNS